MVYSRPVHFLAVSMYGSIVPWLLFNREQTREGEGEGEKKERERAREEREREKKERGR